MEPRKNGALAMVAAGVAAAACCAIPILVATGAAWTIIGWLAAWWPLAALGLGLLAYAGWVWYRLRKHRHLGSFDKEHHLARR